MTGDETEVYTGEHLSDICRMTSVLNPDQPLLATEAFATFCEGLDHPEGLAFDDEGVLWAGGELGQVYRIDRDGSFAEMARLGGFCLGLTFSAAQELWVCNAGLHQLMRMDRLGRVLEAISAVNGVPLVTPNFSVFDGAGNLYFSDSGHWDKADGCVYRLRADGATEWFAGPFAFPNGLALSADERSLLVVESQTDAVLRIAIRDDGTAGEREIYADGLARVPDGLALDEAGNLYVMCYASDCIYRVASGGEAGRRVELLAFDRDATRIARPTNGAFGGPGFEDFYVANLGRWHISRVHLGTRGQRLINMKQAAGRDGTR